MQDSDQRKFERKDSLNIIGYDILGEEGESVLHGMGRTLNVSESGLLLETHNPLSKGQTLMITVGLEDDTVELKGHVTYVASASSETFNSGIEFMEIDENGKRVLGKFLEALKNAKEA